MIGRKKVIGVCLTKINSISNAEYISRLYHYAEKQDYKLVVFNSFVDFYNKDVFDEGAKSVYSLMNFDILDAVVVLCESFCDKTVVDEIVANTMSHNVPVVLVNGENDGCYSIISKYEDAFKSVINHVIKDHGVTDTFFIAGSNDNDTHSETRIRYYREVLEENGLTFDESKVEYGGYWEVPTRKIIEHMIESGKKLPEAFICANDYMAFAVCKTLGDYGYKVPDDIIVTGFDGVPGAEYYRPRLTSCNGNISGMAELSVEVLKKIFDEKIPCQTFYNDYKPQIAESCGCKDNNQSDFREVTASLYRTIDDIGNHEDFLYSYIDNVLKTNSINKFRDSVSECILKNSCVCMRRDIDMLLDEISENRNTFSGQFDIIMYSGDEIDAEARTDMNLSEMIPNIDIWENDSSMYILSSIYVGNEVCGFYAVRTSDLYSVKHKIKRVLKTLNISFNAVFNNYRQNNMKKRIELARYIDPVTGIPNIKGALQWFENFSKKEENRKKYVTVSVYNLPRYAYIAENYGNEAIEESLRVVANFLQKANRKSCFVARATEDDFVVINYYDDSESISEVIYKATSTFFEDIENYNDNNQKEYYVEVNCGCADVYPGWTDSLELYIKHAVGEMLLNRIKNNEVKVVKEEKNFKEFYSIFNLLVKKNLFTYHFQPIVDAKTGNVYAYEALMRTKDGIKMSPLEILGAAREYNRLYDIEKATLFNVITYYVENLEEFDGRKVFINTIPGYFLSQEDCNELSEKYKDYFDNFVFELTEQDTITDNELASIKRFSRTGDTSQIAIDDYGIGHSNIVNLLRYSPQVIKIDRFLIQEIQNDVNKQMFVKNVIEFARNNNIKVLAEGVETSEEMQAVIEYGVDYIQGYYTGRPASQPVASINDKVKKEIIGKNISLSKYNNDMLVYTAQDGETIDLLELAFANYTSINILGGNVTVRGEKDSEIDMVIRVADNVVSDITFIDVNIKGANETTVQLGINSKVTLAVLGDNTLNKEGILVPSGSFLKITGSGELNVINSKKCSVGIGANADGVYGDIVFDMAGKLAVVSTGDKAICIGGGRNNSSSIRFVNGTFDISAQGISVVGVGSFAGNADIFVGNADVTIRVTGNEAVAMGSMGGRFMLDSSGNIDVLSESEQTVGIGTLTGSHSEICFKAGRVSSELHCDKGMCIGSLEGQNTVIKCQGADIKAYGEGVWLGGCGGTDAGTKVEVTDGSLNISFLAAKTSRYGGPETEVIIDGGNVV